MTDPPPSTLRLLSLNCWGLKFLSAHRAARFTHIGHLLTTASPTPDIVCLQEIWTQADYAIIRAATSTLLPHAKFYHSGIFGGGLAILSRYPMVESSMFGYPLNGRPTAFFRGDWFVGKGVACARVQLPPSSPPRKTDTLEVFCTHLHAPYEPEDRDTYICHRTAQAWEIAKKMRHAAERGHLVVGMGDFNMIPLSLAHRLIEGHAPVRDVWRVVYPDSAIGSSFNRQEKERGRKVPTAREAVKEHGATCDSRFNTWRWSKQHQKDLGKGRDRVVDPEEDDPHSQRLDYIFFGGQGGWQVRDVNVGMMEREPTTRCSPSDHFSVEATVERIRPLAATEKVEGGSKEGLPAETYDEILDMIKGYEARERQQRRWRLGHFIAQVVITIGCLTAIWWSPRNFIAFLLMLLSSLGLSAGVIDGLIGGLFVGSELRALREFEWEIRNARRIVEEKGG
ncbi:hypothetical protein KVT40_003018 [Elsinoe batatas]|uniref:Endonuclease/exonuclease/phosphatase domain-containing protein n=1 Tax=Elsinoe batatas TaxID=2601811 RepID=A0A8K0LBE1_9PEZI|nr:hypothetical protein KVT40_003018 [Elsinoe batatas]